MLPGVPASPKKSSQWGAWQVTPVSFTPRVTYGPQKVPTAPLEDHPMSKHSNKMTEDTDGLFETSTCCFLKKLSLRDMVERRGRRGKSPAAFGATVHFSNMCRCQQAGPHRVVPGTSPTSAARLHALSVLRGRKLFFPQNHFKGWEKTMALPVRMAACVHMLRPAGGGGQNQRWFLARQDD